LEEDEETEWAGEPFFTNKRIGVSLAHPPPLDIHAHLLYRLSAEQRQARAIDGLALLARLTASMPPDTVVWIIKKGEGFLS
jgi:hypothetical protein